MRRTKARRNVPSLSFVQTLRSKELPNGPDIGKDEAMTNSQEHPVLYGGVARGAGKPVNRRPNLTLRIASSANVTLMLPSVLAT